MLYKHSFYIVSIGPISYFLKNRLFLCKPLDNLQTTVTHAGRSHSFSAEALLALGLGIIVGPVALDWFSPIKWAGSQEKLNVLT